MLKRQITLPVVLLVICIIGRALTLGSSDLIDTTEGRYANMSRVMVASDSWVIPMIQMKEELVPYLGKPPFYFWTSGLSMEIFGVSAWSARLSSFIAALAVLALTWIYVRKFVAEELATPTVLILFSTVFFFFLSGAAVVDMVLTATIMGAFVSSAFFVRDALAGRKRDMWVRGLVISACLALGFLTKGPVALVLFGLPVIATFILFWFTRERIALLRNTKLLFRSYPWVTSIILFLACTAPWFILAERENPGFIRYFFVNENFLRFVTPNYQDRYGVGHVEPYGKVWLALAVAALPWTLLVPALVAYNRRTFSIAALSQGWVTYAVMCGIASSVFFTFARQFSPLYVLPGLPGLCIGAAWLLSRAGVSREVMSKLGASIALIVTCIVYLFGIQITAMRSTAPILRAANDQLKGKQATIGVHFGKHGNPFSIWFYKDQLLKDTEITLIDLQPDTFGDRHIDGALIQRNQENNWRAILVEAGFTRAIESVPEGRWTLFMREADTSINNR